MWVLMLSGILVTASAFRSPCGAQEARSTEFARGNTAFYDYLRSPKNLDDNYSGLVPEPLALPRSDRKFASAQDALPATYDLRSLSKLTPVRNQGACGSCWAFASIGSLESFLLPKETCDFSENNLKNLSGYDLAHNAGGNRFMSTAYLARWGGPVSEASDPYNPASGVSPAGIPAVKHVQDVIFVQNRASATDNAAIKQAVMTYGAVYTTYYHSDSYFNSSKSAYYYSGTASANHAVCIVGWDDNYAATNFTTRPAGNGAFLIRNSWGSSWGSGGYFWMSYYDSKLAMTENAAFTAESANNYSVIYQYDTLGWTSSIGYSTATAYFANVFTAVSGDPIAAVSWYTAAPGSTYTISIYTSPTNGPMSGLPAAATKSGTIDTAGYHTIKLNTPVPVSARQSFSVVVKLTTPGYNYPVPLEYPYSGYSSKATASSGQSYISSNGTSWSDVASLYANTNVCLKAFAVGSGDTVPTGGTLSVTSATGLVSGGNVGGPFSPSSTVYTLTNTGQSSIYWTASKSKDWVGLSAFGGTLAAGASTYVTVSLSAAAASLTAGSYTDTVSFMNTTNGRGNTTRPVSLTVAARPKAYAVMAEPYSYISPAAHARLSLGDNTFSQLALPFAFTFYGKSYSTLYVSSNGFVGFLNSGLTTAVNTALPAAAVPNAAIYPYWDDLNPARGGYVSAALIGSAPNRKVVISWADVPWGNQDIKLRFSFQVILFEGSNDIVFQYANVSPTNTTYGAGKHATIGIENETGTQALQYSYNTYGAVSNNKAIRIGLR